MTVARRTLSLAWDDFDLSVLPPEARGSKPAARRNAASDFLRREFRKLGGVVQKIEFPPGEIVVTWLPPDFGPDPVTQVASTLTAGDYATGVTLLKLFLSDDPDNPDILYNLGMALSDTGQLDQAVEHLRRLVEVESDHVNGRVALGVALARLGQDEAACVELERAVADDPQNPYARRNLAGCLANLGRTSEAIEHFRVAVGLQSTDPLAWLGLARALEIAGEDGEADDAYARVLEIDEFGDVAERARQGRTRIVERTMRDRAPSGLRMDAVMYMVSALGQFAAMTPQQVQALGFEIALLGSDGLDINDPTPRYQLRNLPGDFSALQLVSTMYAAFQQFAPEQDLGVDLAREYETAAQMSE